MNQGYLADLPSEIIINIFSRLPVRTTVSCKCVCKSWLNLLNSEEFIKCRLSRSSPGLVVFQSESNRELLTLFEFKDERESEHHELHYKPVTKFDLMEFINQPYGIGIEGSANGLLFMRQTRTINEPDALYICNLITREYIKFASPEKMTQYYPTYGFGESKMTGQHKVVRIFHECVRDLETDILLSIPKSTCQVYTLETGSWRIISPGAPLVYYSLNGTFLNGNLHWLVADLKGSFLISCLDLETELFTTFPAPCPLPESLNFLERMMDMVGCLCVGLVALEDRLCLCDNTSNNEIVIWIMKEYGMEKSWSKEFVISKIPNHAGECYEVVYPIKIFKDGDILMSWWDFHMFYYCNKTKTTQRTNIFQLQAQGSLDAMLYTPTFLSLKSFAHDNVSSF